jgi:hypothetical protein
MPLPQEYHNYKLPNASQGSRHFFSLFSASEWGFDRYYEETHSDKNKSKHFKKIVDDYGKDLNWIAQMNGIPAPIKSHARFLLKQKKVSGIMRYEMVIELIIIISQKKMN